MNDNIPLMKWMLSILFCAWIPTMVICQETHTDPNTSTPTPTSLEYETFDLKTAFDSIHYLGEDSWKVYSNGKTGFIDEYFRISIPPEYDDFMRLDLLCIGVKKGNFWAIYSNGEFISDFSFSSMLAKEDDYYIAVKSGQYGYFKNGEFIEVGYIEVDIEKQSLPCDPETGICAETLIEAYQLIMKYLRYPTEARETGIAGEVIILVYTSEFGDIDDIEIIKSAGELLDNATVNLFTEVLNQFNPVKIGGVPVPSISNFQLKYRLE